MLPVLRPGYDVKLHPAFQICVLYHLAYVLVAVLLMLSCFHDI